MIRKLGKVSSDFVALGKSREKYSKYSHGQNQFPTEAVILTAWIFEV